jgi:hypothetical protein
MTASDEPHIRTLHSSNFVLSYAAQALGNCFWQQGLPELNGANCVRGRHYRPRPFRLVERQQEIREADDGILTVRGRIVFGSA